MENRYFQVFIEIESPSNDLPAEKETLLFEQSSTPNTRDIYKAIRKRSELALNIDILKIDTLSRAEFLAIKGGNKDLTQQVFKGSAKWFKWAVVDLMGFVRFFINKPILTDAGVWLASFTGDKVQAEFIEQYQLGTIYDTLGGGYRYEGDIKGDFAILKRKAGV